MGEQQPIKASAPTSFLFTSSKQTFACVNVAVETSLRIRELEKQQEEKVLEEEEVLEEQE